MDMQWVAKEHSDTDKVDKLVSDLGAPRVVASILCQRGIDSEEKVRAFFNPKITDLHDPFLMKDMPEAIQRIEDALLADEGLMVFGDYDVDGTTAVSLTYSFFKDHFKKITYYIPDRYREGYGISKAGIDKAAQEGLSLIIALDCGIRSNELVDYAKSLQIDFIICDHHLPGLELPKAVAVLDPKRSDCEYPFKELSGCGIGFKLCEAFAHHRDLDDHSYLRYLDLVALSIASDIVPILDENRVISHFGLKIINQEASIGLHALKQIAVDKPKLTVGDLVFYLGPRINAAGRLGHASEAVELLICQNKHKAVELAAHLDGRNSGRKDIDAEITADIKQMVEGKAEWEQRKTLVLYKSSWHKGVVGIAASRAVELFYKPTIILTGTDGVLTGSARSIKGFDVHEALEACSEYLQQFGGHTYAAGMSLKEEDLPAFSEAFEAVAQKLLRPEDMVPQLFYDEELSADEVTDQLLHILDKMRPFGPGNRSPVFRANGLQDNGYGKIIGKFGDHLRLNIITSIGSIAAVGFGMGKALADIKKAGTFDACFQIQENVFRGQRSLQLMLKDIKPTSGIGSTASY